ncbi:cell envelope transcriptional attenuator family protein [Gottschalkia purinilytica]|uniref:Cell envelope transcriptional attenuator family protein n=1 Tax=Gottschalkia purinilytica TaxID=1503 RepID=A0A0L0W898_GOTPU|nr:LCP family protein [Gottschalkia purinilytica]KNF07798.1 cell envelope transcriptional attenuator family protein [Gottschalkia purinilytica]
MKRFLKIFFMAFICFALTIGAGMATYYKIFDKEGKNPTLSQEELDKIKDPLEKAAKSSRHKRVNVLLLGMEGARTDTMMFCSFDMEHKKVDVVSIPRDTYYYRSGYERADQRKINAVYGAEKIKGTINAVEDVLGVEGLIDHYAMIDYKGVENIVDSVGGVEVDVPFHMKYFDPTDKPPLRIDIPKGKQTLNGKKAVQFLRFRHDNSYKVGYSEGDLGRIKAQQGFVTSFIDKALSLKFLSLVKTSIQEVETDIRITDALEYGTKAMGIDKNDIKMTTLPGEAEYKQYGKQKLAYFVYDKKETRKLMEDIFGNDLSNIKE